MIEEGRAWYLDQPDGFRWTVLFGAAIVAGLLLRFLLSLAVRRWARVGDGRPFFDDLRRRLSKPTALLLPLLVFWVLQEVLKEPYHWLLYKSLTLLTLLSASWVMVGLIFVMEASLKGHFSIEAGDNLRNRKVYTQLVLLRKFLVVLVVILTLGAVLFSFDAVKNVGRTLFASAGVAGIVLGIAAQKTIGNFVAGIQLAITQPIRIDDVLLIENEWGRVEEITLTYVVVNIWDKRRLVLPIQYFTEKPFQNWSRTTTDLMGTVFLYVGYSVSVEAVRQEFTRQLKANRLWDGKVCVTQVTDTHRDGAEIRLLLSAKDSPTAWDLRCEIRESMITWLQREHPEGLAFQRVALERDPDRAAS